MSTNLEPMDDLNADPGRPGLGLGEGFVAPRPRRRFPTQVLVLLLIVGVSGGALYGMRRYGMKSGIKFDKVEVDFKDTDSEKARTYERVMADLASVQKPLDVALGDFGKSPFMHEAGARVTPNIPQLPIAQTDEERHLQEASAAVNAMHLNGIIGNIARIDQLTVKAGDTLGPNDMLTVKSVEGRAVVLEAYGHEFTIEMEVKKVQGGKGPSKMRALQDRRP